MLEKLPSHLTVPCLKLCRLKSFSRSIV